MVLILVLLLSAPVSFAAETAAELARGVREISLDPEECYRVRDLTLTKEDVRFYLTDGYLAFGRLLNGRRTSALFTSDVEGGDAEVLLLPPDRGERRSLASYINSPNLNEHFTASILTFSDATYEDLMAQIQERPSNRKVPEIGLGARRKMEQCNP